MGTSQAGLRVGIASGDWIHPNKTHDKVERWGGSGWARIGQYIEYLPFDVVWGTLIWDTNRFVIADSEELLHDVDIVIMQRLMHAGIVQNIPDAQAYGQKVINDVDDWYWGLDPTNMAFSHNHPKNSPDENINHYQSILSRSDVVMVSTPYLADRITRFVRGKIVLTTNTVDVARFTPRVHTDDLLPIVGWVGSTPHRSRDLETLQGILPPLVRSGEVTLHHSGDSPKAPSFASRIGIDPFLVTTKPLASHFDYPSLMVMDIGIVPLKDVPFNRAKSAIKGLEYAAAGVPFVAQDLDAYLDLATDGVGRIAKRPVNWLKHIRALYSADVRTEEAQRNRAIVQEKYDIKYGAERLIDIISNI